MRLLSERDVMGLIDADLAIESAEKAFVAATRGAAQVPLRAEYFWPPDGVALVMSGLVEDRVLGMKMVGSVESEQAVPGATTGCMIVIWDARTLTPRGLIEADVLNDYRTAAGLAAATKALARPNCRTHVLFGAGKLSYPSALYIAHVRPIERLILVSRSQAPVEALAERVRATPELADLKVETDLSADDAVAEADIVTTVTRAIEPLFDGARVRPGTHVNLGGAMRRHEREVDDGIAERAIYFLDDDESCRLRAGDVALALESGALDEDRIMGEFGAVIAGDIEGRTNDEEITAFKSLGVATQDLYLGAALLDRAEADGVGAEFDPVEGVVGG